MGSERERDERGRNHHTPRPAGRAGSPRFAGRVTTAAPGCVPGLFITLQPVTVTGAEAEGQPGTFTDYGATVAVYFMGPRPTAPGEVLLARWADFRWVAARGGHAGTTNTHNLTGCACTAIPATVAMTCDPPPPDQGPDDYLFPATLAYGPKPADLAMYQAADPGYYTTVVMSSRDGTARFRYAMICSFGNYSVFGMMTPDSPLGYPGSFPIMRWLPGLARNTCSPFSMHAGATDTTAYRTRHVFLDG